ncbi:GDYXXLXY domain-containing protein [Comamonas composti]|uniref:GDYXXLXY domain-containing protein n=1 Tax=Comamonas composti TaxID=408558 RepID=UPI00041CFEEA|nr:GDYXXLXY domain-containing protein [Comamonas composti]
MKFFSHTPVWWEAARSRGLVQGDAEADAAAADEPSVFVIVLAMLGAVVCSALLLGLLFLGLGMERLLTQGLGGVVLGTLMIAGAAAMLRGEAPIFVLCLALVFLGAGQILVGIRIGDWVRHEMLGLTVICGLVALVQLLAASMTAALWVRQILGVVFGAALYAGLLAAAGKFMLLAPLHPTGLILALAWGVWIMREPGVLQRPGAVGWAVFADAAVVGLVASVMAGWGKSAVLLSLAEDWHAVGSRSFWQATSALLTLGVLAGLLWRWRKTARLEPQAQALLVLAGLALAVCAWFSPSMAVLAAVAAVAAVGARWRILVLCALGALWQLGQFYYLLSWPLAYKGLGLALLGGALLLGLGLTRVWMRPAAGEPVFAAGPATRQRHVLAGLLLGSVLVFGLVNWDVAGKEAVVAKGQPILMPLVPVDPRSLMQGDYMSLRFDLPSAIVQALDEQGLAATAQVVASLDDKGVATVLRLARSGKALGAGEILLPLKRLKGGWVLVTDAYFFPEGQGQRFEQARYGDFRALPDGRALLVGLADDQGRPIPVEMKKE